MTIKEQLIPFSAEHSVKESVLTIFLASKILNTKDFEKMMDGSFKDIFSQFEPIESTKVKIENENLSILGELDAGFNFVKFNARGKKSEIFRGVNEDNRFFISFHSFDYSNWNSFRDNFLDYIKKLDSFRPGNFIKAYSLSYVDEFEWRDSKTYEASKMFNKNSRYLSKDFFDSKNTIFKSINHNTDEHQTTSSEQLDIIVSDKIVGKSIIVNHNKAILLSNVTSLEDLINSDSFTTNLNNIHSNNKDVLKDLLKDEVCTKIGLTT